MKQNLLSWVLFLPLSLLHLAVTQAAEPVRVFILAGQSNMEGHGMIPLDAARNEGKGSLEYVVRHTPDVARLGLLRDDGSWRERDDVWISYLDREGPLKAGYGVNEDRIGPELGFGWVVGDALQAPVLLIKCAWGGKSLGLDFRPPSAGKPPYSLGEKTDAEIAADPTIVGRYYRELVSRVKATLDRVGEIVPGSDAQFVLAGFGWHQGWNDRVSQVFNDEYEQNLTHFIRDIRRDLKTPTLPFVIAETGMSGHQEKHPRALSLMKAQAAVAKLPEFRRTVAFVTTRDFWRPETESPTSQSYHWNSNAETYLLIGQGMGKAMLGLMPRPPVKTVSF
jgi:alpha-galactosidase